MTLRTLRWTIVILTVLGCQRPFTWTSASKKFLYNAYTLLVLIFVQNFLISAILDLIFNVEDQDDFSDNLFSTIAIVVSSFKLCSFLTNREIITILIKNLEKEPFLPVNQEEYEIRTRFDKIIDMRSIQYTAAIEVCIAFTWISTLLIDGKNRKLAFRTWIPYDYSSLTSYSLTYVHHVVTVTISSLMHPMCDTLFSGLMLFIYGQLEILEYRLQNITKHKKDSAKKCVRYHNYIYQFAANVNKIFQGIVSIQILSSIGMICFTLYRMTQVTIRSKVVEMFMYTICMLMQIFYYCYHGDRVKWKSLEIPDLIITSEWTDLDNDTKKILLMIMRRSTFSIQFTGSYVVSVNLESFMTVVKTSYSAFNLLQKR